MPENHAMQYSVALSHYVIPNIRNSELLIYSTMTCFKNVTVAFNVEKNPPAMDKLISCCSGNRMRFTHVNSPLQSSAKT